MENINIAGRLGGDAQTARTQGGDDVANFNVAVDSRNGREKTTNWYRCALWGKRAAALSQYLTKGTSVAVSGAFSLDEYNGKPQLNVRVNEITLQGGGEQRSAGGDGDNRTQQGGGQSDKQSGIVSNYDDLDDGIPF